LKAEISAVSNIMEEVGLLERGKIAYSLKPDLALVVDVTHATITRREQTAARRREIGRGPTLTHGGCNHPEVVARLEAVAQQKGSTPARSDVGDQRHGHRRDFLDAWRNSQRVDQPAEPLHALAGRTGQPQDLEKIPELIAGFALSLKRSEQFS